MASAQHTPAATDQSGQSPPVSPGPTTTTAATATAAATAWEPASTCRVRSRRLREPPRKSEVPHRPLASRASPFGATLTAHSRRTGPGP